MSRSPLWRSFSFGGIHSSPLFFSSWKCVSGLSGRMQNGPSLSFFSLKIVSATRFTVSMDLMLLSMSFSSTGSTGEEGVELELFERDLDKLRWPSQVRVSNEGYCWKNKLTRPASRDGEGFPCNTHTDKHTHTQTHTCTYAHTHALAQQRHSHAHIHTVTCTRQKNHRKKICFNVTHFFPLKHAFKLVVTGIYHHCSVPRQFAGFLEQLCC